MMPDQPPTLATSQTATLTYQGHTYSLFEGRILLNWRDRKLSRPRPCRYCRRPAFFTDDDGRQVHKTCHEIALTARLLAGPADLDRAA